MDHSAISGHSIAHATVELPAMTTRAAFASGSATVAEHAIREVTRAAAPPGLAPWRVRRLVAYVDSNLGHSIKNTALAASVSMSPSHLSRLFKCTFGMSPHAWIMLRRVQAAQDLMLTTDATLTDIALSCGMSDQSHFTRLFRRWVGETPFAWRQTRRGTRKMRGMRVIPPSGTQMLTSANERPG